MLVGVMFLPLERDDEVLLAPGDAQVSLGVELTQVARPHEVAFEDLARRLVVAVVALEHVRAAEQDLAVLGDLDRRVAQGRPDGAEARVLGRVEGRGRAGLRHAVALQHGDPTGVEELEDLERDRCRAGQRQLEPAAEQLADAGEHQTVGERVLGLERGREPSLASGGPSLAAGRHRPAEQALLDGAAFLAARERTRVDLLEHARDGWEVGRLGGRHVLDQLARVAAPERQRAAHVERHHLHHARQRVRERKEHEQRRRRPQVDALDVRLHREEDVAVREHAALRRSRRARRVDDGGHVVGPDVLEARLELLGRHLARPRAEVGDRQRASGVRHAHDVLEARQLVADLLDLLELPRVLDHDRPRARVLDDVLALPRRVRVVDRDDHAAGGQQRGVGQRPLRAGLAEQRDAVAGLDPERREPPRQLADRVPELRERPLVPRAVTREADRRAAVPLGRVQHHSSQGVRAHGPRCCHSLPLP